jgi:two-component system cell cycle response regulator DivK
MLLREAKVAVIEDNQGNLALFRDLLIERIKVAFYYSQSSGEMFFRWLSSEHSIIPDVIFLDIQMPFEDGYSIFEQLRQKPELLKTKVIAVTANVLQPNLIRAQKVGFDGLLGKPIRISTFEAQVNRILAGEMVWDI